MDLIDNIELMIRLQNIYLIKYIAIKENLNYKDLCKKYIK
tara:strand:- start:1223 stop:1342 length:120 start_codon:yes stop_codon:yes gene_type:complete